VVRKSVLARLTGGLLLTLALVAALVAPAASGAAAQEQATTIILLESPSSSAPVSTRMMVSGWAADPTGQDSGVDRVLVYLGDPHNGGQELGLATYGQPRPDVVRTLGDNRFANSGFQLAVELPPGDYGLTIYAHKNTAGPDEGWVVHSATFSASASVRPDPQAVALLGGEQPQVRTAAPGTSSSTTAATGPSGRPTNVDRAFGGGTNSGGFSATSPDGVGIRTTVSRHDPIPLEPTVPGMSSAQGIGRGDIELADATGSGAGIRTSVASEPVGGASTRSGQYQTGSVTLTGGGGNTCPGPNCPANTQAVNQAMQNLPPNLVRELIGYNIPGLGNNTPCIPTNAQGAPGACNPTTGSSIQPGAPTGIQQLQSQNAAAMQAAQNQPSVLSPVNTGPACQQYGSNGQCTAVAGSQGPLGSTCLRFAGSQCVYYGQPQAGAAGQAAPGALQGAAAAGLGALNQLGATNPMAGTNPLAATGPLGGSGCAQWGGSGQCLAPAATGAAGRNDGFMPGLAMTYQPGVVSPAGGTPANSGLQPVSVPITQTAPAGVSSAPATATSPYGGVAAPGMTGGGICLQFGAGGTCVRSQ
jgi:hypothetical protein